MTEVMAVVVLLSFVDNRKFEKGCLSFKRVTELWPMKELNSGFVLGNLIYNNSW
jgi:hypothetical protein